MYTIKELADHIGLSSSQLRRRLKALNGLVEKRRGSDNCILVDHNGLELLKRLENHRKTGMTTEQAVEDIKKELEKDSEKPERESDKPRQSTEKLEGLKTENRRLKEENSFLKNQIEKKDNQIQQLLPGTQKEKKDDFEELSLFQVIKKWFTTKT